MSILRLELVTAGDLSAAVLFDLAERGRHAKPAMQSILSQVVEDERRLYDTEGGSGGEPWPEDKESTLERKRRDSRSLDLRTERATGALERSLTERNPGKNRIRRASQAQLTFGTKLFYAQYQTARPLMQFTQENVETWESTLSSWLMNGDA